MQFSLFFFLPCDRSQLARVHILNQTGKKICLKFFFKCSRRETFFFPIIVAVFLNCGVVGEKRLRFLTTDALNTVWKFS